MTLPAVVRATLKEALDYAARAVRDAAYDTEGFRRLRLAEVERAKQWLKEQV